MQQDMQKYRLSDLTEVVTTTHRLHIFDTEPNTDEIKELWNLDNKYPNIVRLISFLDKNPRIEHLGGGTFELRVDRRGKLINKRDIKNESLYIGIPVLNVSPLRWFWLLGKHFDALPSYLFNDLERLVGEILDMIKKSQPPDR